MAFDFSHVEAPFRMQPGLRRLPAGAPQFTPARWGDEVLRAKLEVLTRAPDEALTAAPGCDPQPLWQRVAERIAAQHPDALRLEVDGVIAAPALGWFVRAAEVGGSGPAAIGRCLRELPAPQRLAGLLALAVAEDLAVLDGATGRVPCLAVCLPSRWAPEHRVGEHFAEIHAGVADGAALRAAAEPLVRLLVGGSARWERWVWTLTASPQLDAHPRRVPTPAWAETAEPEALAAAACLRTERQTFSAFEDVGQALFSIHVEVRPLAAALSGPQDAARLHAALASMSPAVLAYRGLAPARERLLRWLEARRGG